MAVLASSATEATSTGWLSGVVRAPAKVVHSRAARTLAEAGVATHPPARTVFAMWPMVRTKPVAALGCNLSIASPTTIKAEATGEARDMTTGVALTAAAFVLREVEVQPLLVVHLLVTTATRT